MQKQTKYEWKETNMALFGSDLEKRIKEASAKGEPEWTGVGNSIELLVWRIEQFRVVPWPQSKYGKFHEGDSYMVCNTYKETPSAKKFSHDIHFWIGTYSSQDEYGTAAYKTVELDNKLKGAAVQHREIMGHESKKFLSYFPQGVRLLKGGTESGFTHVETNFQEINPVLLWIKGNKDNLVLKEVKLSRSKMNSGDVFVLDIGPKIWQWNGTTANIHEKRQGALLLHNLSAERAGRCETFTIEEGEDTIEAQPEFCQYLPHQSKGIIFTSDIKVQDAEKAGDDDEITDTFTPVLYSIENNSTFNKLMTSDKFPKNVLEEDFVYLLDTGFHIFIWIGKDAPSAITMNSMQDAMVYLKKFKRPAVLPISRVSKRSEPSSFKSYFTSEKMTQANCQCTIM